MFRGFIRNLVLVSLMLAPSGLAWGQGEDPRPVTGRSGASSGDDMPGGRVVVREAALQTYYLKRENGELVPYFDIPFEEFDEIYRLYRGIDESERPRRYSVTQLTVAGRVENSSALLDIRVTIRANADGWVQVPLGLNECRLRAPQSHVDGSVAFLAVDESDGGLVCWLKGSAGEEAELTLNVVQPVLVQGDEYRMQLQLADAAYSKLDLLVPIEDAVFRPLDDATLQEVETTESGYSAIEALGKFGADGFDLSWRGRAGMNVSVVPLDVTSRTTVTIQNQTDVRWQAEFTVEGLGDDFESFDLYLPAEAELVRMDQPGYEIELLDSSQWSSRADGKVRRRVRVSLNSATRRAEEILIHATRSSSDRSSEFPIDLAGFEVVDAFRHAGTLDLYAASREWIVDWQAGTDLARTSLPPASPRLGIPLAGFEFTRQPTVLQARIDRQATKIEVDPVIKLSATRSQVDLQATFRVAIAGPPARQLEIDLRDWQLTDLDAPGVMREYEVSPEDPNRYVIYLDPTALTGTSVFELQLSASRELGAGVRQLQLPVPIPVGATLAPTTLIVSQFEGILLQPDRSVMQPVADETLPEWYVATDSIMPSNVYRGLLTTDQSSVDFELLLRPQSVSVRTSVNARVNNRGIQTTAVIDLRIKNQPLSQLEFLVPTKLFEDSDLVVSGEAGEWRWTQEEIDSGDGQPLTALRLEFAEPLMGSHRLSAEYQVPFRVSATESLQEILPVALPLPQPAISLAPRVMQTSPFPLISPIELLRASLGDRVADRYVEVNFEHPYGLELVADEVNWTSRESRDERGFLVTSFSTSEPHPLGMLNFGMRDVRMRTSPATAIDRMWVQTHLTSAARQDRAVFHFTTQQSRIRLAFPPQTVLRAAALNGEQIPDLNRRFRNGVLELPGDRRGEEEPQTLEVWYRFTNDAQAQWPLTMQWPRIEGTDWVDRFYWQLIAPSDQHLVWSSAGMASENDWKLGATLFERQSRLSQNDLEQWCGVQPQARATAGANVYLFSSFGQPREVQVTLLNRRLLILGICALTFLGGLMIIYVRALRSPVLLLALAAVIAILGVWQVDLALLAMQIALVTTFFVLIAELLRHILLGPRTPLQPVTRPTTESSSIVAVRTRVPVATSGAPLSHQSTSPTEPLSISSSHAKSAS